MLTRIGVIKVGNLKTPAGREVLPDDWSGICWPATGWIDCRTFVDSPRFGWEFRMGAYDPDTEVVVLNDPAATCTDPQWCERCKCQNGEQCVDGRIECWDPGGPCPTPNDPACDLCGECLDCASAGDLP